MYFCPNCSYILDIGKSSNIIYEDDKIITKVNDLFTIIESKKDLTEYKIEIQNQKSIR